MARISSDDFVRIARRYDSVLHRCFGAEQTTLPTTSFPAYATRFLEQMQSFVGQFTQWLGDGPYEHGFSVSRDALDWIDRHHPGLAISIEQIEHFKEPPTFIWTMTRSGYRDLLSDVCERVLRKVQAAAARVAVPLFVRTAAPTYGVFALDGGREIAAMTKDGQRTLPGGGQPRSVLAGGSPAVLVCANAFDRLESALRDQGYDPDPARQAAADFLVCTVVHEHFHAAIATGK